MAVFRDITVIGYPSGSDTIAGCQEVSIECSGDEIEHSECVDAEIRYRGLTNLACTGEATVNGGATLHRDVHGVSFDGTSIPDVLSVDFTETANELSDASDADTWLTVIGVTQRSVEANVTSRDVKVIAGFMLGDVGKLIAKAKLGSLAKGTNDGAPDGTYEADSMMVVSTNPQGTHADFAEGTLSLKATALVSIFTGDSLGGVHTGHVGTFVFGVKSAEGGPSCTFSLKNAVLMEKSITLAQGEMAVETFSVKAFSDDGLTSPLSVS